MISSSSESVQIVADTFRTELSYLDNADFDLVTESVVSLEEFSIESIRQDVADAIVNMAAPGNAAGDIQNPAIASSVQYGAILNKIEASGAPSGDIEAIQLTFAGFVATNTPPSADIISSSISFVSARDLKTAKIF